MNYVVHTGFERWLKYPPEQWVRAMSYQHDGLYDAELAPILEELYALFPQPGAPSHPPVLVQVRLNNSIPRHQHDSHTIVFYIDVGEPMCPITIGDEEVPVRDGMVVHILPRVRHEVRRSRSERIRYSLALRWKQGEEHV